MPAAIARARGILNVTESLWVFEKTEGSQK